MPAYMHHHEVDMAAVICPGCIGLLPMFVRDVEPHWSMAKIDFIYECSECGAEVGAPAKATVSALAYIDRSRADAADCMQQTADIATRTACTRDMCPDTKVELSTLPS